MTSYQQVPYDTQYQQYSQPPNYPPQPAPTYGAPVYNPEAPLPDGQTSKVAKNYNPKPKYQDKWASILFVIHLIGFAVLSYFAIKKFLEHSANANPAFSLTLDDKAIMIMAFTIIFAFVLSIIYLLLMQRFPKPLIKITFVVSVLLYIASAAYYAYLRQWIGTIIFAAFALLYALSYYFWRNRIPFAILMLETVTAITRKHFGTIVISIAALVVQVAYSVWWMITIVGTFQLLNIGANCQTSTDPRSDKPTSDCISATSIVVMVFVVFSFYWTSMVIKTVAHVTISGVFATQYFLQGTPFMPKSPSISSLGRALTTSFGSICFGSLLIAILQTIKALLRSAINNQGGDNPCCVFFAVCALCLLNCIGDLFEYFNYYAYTEVAIYGKPYCQAAKDTWALIKDRGVEAIINDNLIGNVLGAGNLLIAALSGLFAFGVLSAENPVWNANGSYTWVIILVGVLVGLMTSNVVTGVVSSGVATTFVALAEDPAALGRSNPALYNKIVQTWPRVVQGVSAF